MPVTGTDIDLALRDPKSFLYQLVMNAIDKEQFDLMKVLQLVQENYEQRLKAKHHEQAAYEQWQAKIADQVSQEIFKDKPYDSNRVATPTADSVTQGESLAGLQSKLTQLNDTIQSLNAVITQCNTRLSSISTNWNTRQTQAATTYVQQTLLPQLTALNQSATPVLLPGSRPLPPPPPMDKLVKAVTRISPVQLYQTNPDLLEKPVEHLLNFSDVMAELRLKAALLGKTKTFASDCLAFNQQTKDITLPKHSEADNHDFVNAQSTLIEKREHESELSACERVKASLVEAIAHHHTKAPSP